MNFGKGELMIEIFWARIKGLRQYPYNKRFTYRKLGLELFQTEFIRIRLSGNPGHKRSGTFTSLRKLAWLDALSCFLNMYTIDAICFLNICR